MVITQPSAFAHNGTIDSKISPENILCWYKPTVYSRCKPTVFSADFRRTSQRVIVEFRCIELLLGWLLKKTKLLPGFLCNNVKILENLYY